MTNDPVVTQNPDRVTPPVLTRSAILAVLGVLTAVGVDLGLDVDQTNRLVDALLIILPVLATVAGAVWGARFKARNQVTPILPGDTPRDQAGVELRRAGHTETTGYPPRRERPRVDRRGVDRDVPR
jgi:hypothetical protein